MRVIAGEAKGRALRAPKGLTTRPTSDKVRGAIFSMLESLLEVERPATEDGEAANLWSYVYVLDLYAGTGALGIEALSRGAALAEFVESDSIACQAIRDNLTSTRLAPRGRVHCSAVKPFLRRTAEKGKSYHLVLADPPYAEPFLEELVDALGSSELLTPDGRLVLEHSCRRALPDVSGKLVRVRHRRHGDTDVSIYSRLRVEPQPEAPGGDAGQT